ncbi:MAG: glycosyltransferase, partial [Candidatus Aenigmarchaeota archaeon]|nr:glycosyltransferase [Candidatus Aenigmarchaeota archaeon]
MDFGASGRHHSLYDEILQAPPEGVQYIVPQIPVSRFPKPVVELYQKIRSTLQGKVGLEGLARRVSRATAANYDLVHFANHIDRVSAPFVVDFEHALSFLGAGATVKNLDAAFARVRTHRTRTMESSACRFLLPWTKEGAKSLWKAFPSKIIKEMTRVLHLAMRIPENHMPLKHNNFCVLFLGTSNLTGDWNFYYRGGRRMLRVFERFAKGKEDVELIMTGEVPASEQRYVDRIASCKATGLLGREQLERTMRRTDVLFYPSYSTPGLAFLEA